MTLFEIDLQCPKCGNTWHAATIDPSAWWGAGVTGQVIAKQCYCPGCDHSPPMRVVVTVDVQDEVFELRP